MTTDSGQSAVVLACGDAAFCVDFGEQIDLAVNRRVIALDAAVAAHAIPGVVETVPTYRSLMVHVDPCLVDHARLAETLAELAERTAGTEPAPARRWRVPVVYGGEFGVDLDLVAATAGLTPEAAVELHAASRYHVYMIGFLPGFTYLGGMDARLSLPRREQPRPLVPASSVAIGGSQTALGSVASPSGWHLIGRSPVRPFMVGREPEFLFTAGDEIVFQPIAASEWDALDAAASRGAPVAERLDA